MRVYDRKFLNLAEQQACRSDMKHKIGSVLVVNKKTVLNKGYNRWTGYNPIKYSLLGRGSLHAEIDTIKDFVCYKGHLTLYVAREDYKISKPCEHCLAIIKKTNIKRIVYTVNNNIFEEIYL